jgi:chromate transporter
VIGILCLEYAHTALLRQTLGGISAAAAGLIVATDLRLLWPHRHNPKAIVFAALALMMLVMGKLPLLAVLLILAPASIAAAAPFPAAAR